MPLARKTISKDLSHERTSCDGAPLNGSGEDVPAPVEGPDAFSVDPGGRHQIPRNFPRVVAEPFPVGMRATTAGWRVPGTANSKAKLEQWAGPDTLAET